jgi:hypothetical protein
MRSSTLLMFILFTPSSLEIPLPLLIDCEDAKVHIMSFAMMTLDGCDPLNVSYSIL